MLLRIALVIAAIGLAVLIIIARQIEVNDTTVERIGGSSVRLKGKVVSVSGNTMIEISRETTEKVFAFGNVSVEKGSVVEIVGRLDGGRIIADKITVLG